MTSRLGALVAYGAILAWCAYKLPTTLAFVVPGVAVAVLLHTVKGRPVLAALGFVAIVVVPALLWPSMLTGTFADLGGS